MAARDGRTFRAALRRAGRAVAVAPFVAVTLSGCYSYRRFDSAALTPGVAVAAEITDQGRVALADSLGPSPQRVEGRLISASDSAITLSMTGVRSLNGERTTWTGERVTLRRSSVSQVLERRLAVGRTVAVSAAVVGGVIAFLLTTSLLGSSSGEPGDRTPPPGKGEQ